MKPELAYRYIVLRYQHDVRTEEFLNVAVLFWAPDRTRLEFVFSERAKRLTAAFPGVETDRLCRSLRELKSRFEKLHLEASDDIQSIARKALPCDDSSLRWSTPRAGHSTNLDGALEHAFHSMVTLYEARPQKHVRSDADIWKEIENYLRPHNVLYRFHPASIKSPIREYRFNHSWMNGRPHVLAPISLDGEDRDAVADKTTKWVGQIVDLTRSREDFRLDLVIGEPIAPEFRSEYRSAIDLLDSGLDKGRMHIVPREEVPAFTKKLVSEIKR